MSKLEEYRKKGMEFELVKDFKFVIPNAKNFNIVVLEKIKQDKEEILNDLLLEELQNKIADKTIGYCFNCGSDVNLKDNQYICSVCHSVVTIKF